MRQFDRNPVQQAIRDQFARVPQADQRVTGFRPRIFQRMADRIGNHLDRFGVFQLMGTSCGMYAMAWA